MGHQFHLDFDGQSVTQDDYNGLGAEAGTADDKVLAELFRLAPDAGTIARGILPYAHATSGTTALIAPNGASGTIKVNPFRAIIGSRTVEGTDAALCWQDTRSGISVADGAAALATTVSIGANSSGNPRWDAIYAIVTIDNPSTPVTRKVKNPSTSVVTDQSVSINRSVLVAVDIAPGTPGAGEPAFPTIPADGGNIYYILLGYVRVPDGFGAGSTVATADVNTVASVISMSRAMGVATLQPANQQFSGTGIASEGTSAQNSVLEWTGTTATRPGVYMPPTMQGQESRLIAIDLLDASSANWSHQDGDVLDNSIDWRNRIFKWMVYVGNIGTPAGVFPWAVGGGADAAGIMCSAHTVIPSPGVVSGLNGSTYQLGFGQSMAAISGNAIVVELKSATNIPNTIMVAATEVFVRVDMSTGELKLHITGVPRVSVFVWLDATAPYENV